MKKIFALTAPNKKPERQLDSVRNEINKYIARERRKARPENIDFWDFDCKIGSTSEDASEIKVSEIKAMITEIAAKNKTSLYLEILTKPGYKPKNK